MASARPLQSALALIDLERSCHEIWHTSERRRTSFERGRNGVIDARPERASRPCQLLRG
jgi:hypothetical protein